MGLCGAFRRRFRDDTCFHCGTTVQDGRDFDLQKQKIARGDGLSTFELLLLLRRWCALRSRNANLTEPMLRTAHVLPSESDILAMMHIKPCSKQPLGMRRARRASRR